MATIAPGPASNAVHLAIALTLMASTTILKVIKETGVNLVASIAGLLLAAIAIQMIADAIAKPIP